MSYRTADAAIARDRIRILDINQGRIIADVPSYGGSNARDAKKFVMSRTT